uniref:Ovule protein n=1 Tax=Haemonchus placei TaxID=6290 RepID=A0A0N4XA37_HAEPC
LITSQIVGTFFENLYALTRHRNVESDNHSHGVAFVFDVFLLLYISLTIQYHLPLFVPRIHLHGSQSQPHCRHPNTVKSSRKLGIM